MATPTQASGFWAVAATQRPGEAILAIEMPMRRTWGAAGAVEGKGEPAGTVASLVADGSGRAGLPRPPSLPGSRLNS